MMDDYSSKLSIDTPENIVLDAEIAGFGSRCIAAIIDYTILLLLLIVSAVLFTQSVSPRDRDETGFAALLVLIQFSLISFYHLIFELIWNGQTPGKRRAGIRVVQSNGLPVTVSGVLIRNLVRLFDFLPFFYGVGLIVLFATKNTQRLGDLAARTIVIRERRQLTLNTLKENLTVNYWHVKPIDPIPHYVQIDRLTDADRRTVVDFLQRRAEMRSYEGIAQMLAQNLARKMEDETLVQNMRHSPKQAGLFLEQIARAFEIAERTEDQ